MKKWWDSVFEVRLRRHILFWICWVLGFTFVKSFGKAYEVYLNWLIYYLVTLPIFIPHTYLVAYVLIPRFFTLKRWPWFVGAFLGSFYGFSVLELILSNELVNRWFPVTFEIPKGYLAVGNVVRSGVGNLYIVLVFLAARTVREWYLADNRRKEMLQIDLEQQMEERITRVQPMMLLYAIDGIDRLVVRSPGDATHAIALTSELLYEVMMYHEEGRKRFTREVELVKKLSALAAILRGTPPEVEYYISGDPGQIDLPPMVLFTVVNLVFRKFADRDYLPDLHIEASGYSGMITIQMLNGGKKDIDIEGCLRMISQIESIYPGRIQITFTTHGYGCLVMIRRNPDKGAKSIYPGRNDVRYVKIADG
jgi:hypothetical protein